MAGASQRKGKVKATPVQSISAAAPGGLIADSVQDGSTIYTDDSSSCKGLKRHVHEAVNHSAKEYVRGDVHTNSIESFRSLFKRSCYGAYHKMSPKHLHRFANECAGRHNIRDLDTIEQLKFIASECDGKILRYKALIKDNGLSSMARPVAIRQDGQIAGTRYQRKGHATSHETSFRGTSR